MDQEEIRIKRNIDETRAAMDEKIDMIANRVYQIIKGPKIAADNLIENLAQAKKAMQEQTWLMDKCDMSMHRDMPMHQAVAETVERVQAISYLIERVNQNPWTMLGSALVVGYIIGSLNRGNLLTIRHAHSDNIKVERSIIND
jgi:ElaB/YqjD/DUF883 family membrane-anchored ribosome-binding protein